MTVSGQKILVGVLGLALCASVFSVGYVEKSRKAEEAAREAAKPKLAPNIQRGRAVFLKYSCSICHGDDGTGGVANINSQTAEKVAAVNKVKEGYTRNELIKKIQEGVAVVEKKSPSGPQPPLYMPAFKDLISYEEMNLLIDYLFSLAPAGDDW